jgi:putative chitinase
MPADKHFFDTVRPLFGGRLKQHQVEGMSNIVGYGEKWGYEPGEVAYSLATTKKETASWMQPIREGARRYGPSYSDASAKRAVAAIHAKGIISTNYALPAGPYRQSYYGRGLIQITWYDNYRKFTHLLKKPLDKQPDLALEWDIALDIMFLGLRDGLFRKGLGFKDFDFNNYASVFEAREAVNGDKNRSYGGPKKIGKEIADNHFVFLKALGG